MRRTLGADLRRLVAYREVLWALLIRDVKVRYKQTLLGAMWALLQPLSMALVLSLVGSSLAGKNAVSLPYFIFVFAAVLPWNLFATSLAVGGTCVANHASLLNKVDFPREVIPLATVLSNVLDYGVGVLILLVVLPFFQVDFHLTLLIMPIVLVFELFFVMGLVLLLSAINVFYRDIRYIVPLLSLLWLFMTPVFYPISGLAHLAQNLVVWNPMSWVVELQRATITGEMAAVSASAPLLMIVSVVLFGIGYALFKRWEPGFADVIEVPAAIEVKHVSKAFLPRGNTGSLRSAVARWFGSKVEAEQFWALRDVDFEIAPGEVFGVIGHNGSGKSTLLKLLAGIMQPTSGSISVSGRVAPLIEVGAGFHPELTGRENIYLNGAIMGLRHREIDKRFDEIVAFSGLEEFLDRPVKHYSSGMYMRLGFSIAICVDPQVLLVDEVLAVGDQAFQQACLERVRKMRDQGVAIILVSHNLFAITSMCQRVLLLKTGKPLCLGPASQSVLEYEADLRQTDMLAAKNQDTPKESGDVRITDVRIEGAAETLRPSIASGHDVAFSIDLESGRRVPDPVWTFAITRSDGLVCGASNSLLSRQPARDLEGNSSVRLCLPNLTLVPGIYAIDVAVCEAGMSLELSRRTLWFEVTSEAPNLDPRFYGVVLFDHRWEFQGA